jgi:SAM-dependent methyltransferase
MTSVYSSSLGKEQFFSRIRRFNLENVLKVSNSGRTEPTGFIINGVWVSIFIGPEDSVWVGLGKTKDNPESKDALISDLRLSPTETYPYVLESPSNEVRAIWNETLESNPLKGYLDFYSTKLGKAILESEVRYVQEWLKDCHNALDVGCGPGVLERELDDERILGLDPSADMLQLARSQTKDRFIQGSAEKLPFMDSSFDCMFFVTSLEFVEDYKAAIGEALRVLREKGKILVLLLNPRSDYFKWLMMGGSYLKNNIKNTDINAIEEHISKEFKIDSEYILGVLDDGVFKSSDPDEAAIYSIRGVLE